MLRWENRGTAWILVFQQQKNVDDRSILSEISSTPFNRPILLLMDNASSHVTEDLTPHNIKILPFPANITSKYQSLDAGIIAAFKKHYHRRQIQ